MATNERDIDAYDTGEPIIQNDEYVSGGDELDDEMLEAIGNEFVAGEDEGEGESVGEEGEAEGRAPSTAPDSPPASEGEEEAEPTSQPEATADSTLAPQTEQPTQAPTFKYRADGTEYEVPGARIREEKSPDGTTRKIIEIPEDQWNAAVQPRLANREKLYQQRQELLKRIEERNAEYDPTVKTAEGLIEQLTNVLELDDADFLQWRDDFVANRPAWMAGQRAAAAEARAQAMQGATEEVDPIELQIMQEQVETELRGGLNQWLEGYIQSNPDYAGIPVGAVMEDLWAVADTVIIPAKQDMVVEGQFVRQGDPTVDTDFVKAKLDRYAEILKAERVRQAEAQKIAQQNQKVLQGGNRKPRQAGARTGGGAQPRTAPKSADDFGGGDDWKRDFMRVNEDDYADIL